MEITRLRYNRYENKLYSKTYGSKAMQAVDFCYRFYAKAGELKTCPQFEVTPCLKKNYFTGELVDEVKLLTDNFELFKNAAPNIKNNLYLYDVSPEYQYLIQNNIKLSNKYNVAYLDIETEDDLNADAAQGSILMLSILYVEYGKTKAKIFSKKDYSSEEGMLKAAMKFLCEDLWPDIILGWNVIDYDRKYIINRCKNLNVKYNTNRFHMITFVNGMDIIIKKYGYAVLKETGGMKLDNVSKHFLGRGKIPFEGGFKKLYETDYEKAVKYNLRDMMLVKDLDEKLNLIPFLVNLQSVSGAMIHDTFFNSVLIDVMIMNKYRDYVFASRFGYIDEETEQYEGGFVFAPPKGVFENVCCLDVSSMYPSIILTYNISPDTKSPDGDIDIDGIKFKSKPDGLFTDTIRFLYTTRLKLKGDLKKLDKTTIDYGNLDSLQSAYKTILNSVYGVMAFRNFRFYDVDIAKSITCVGRKLIKYVSSCIENNDMGKCIYGDTDSIFLQYKVTPDEMLETVNNKFIPAFNKLSGIEDGNVIQMELKGDYPKMALFGKKKNYVCQESHDEFLIRGLATEKYDTPKPIRTMYSEIIPKLFNENGCPLTEYVEKINKSGFEDLISLKKFNKPKHEYKVVPQHLKALKFSMKYLPLEETTKDAYLVKMIYVKVDSEKFKGETTDAVIVDDNIKSLPDGIVIDYDKYVQFFLRKKLYDLYDVFNVLDQLPPEPIKIRKTRKKKVEEPETFEDLNILD